MLIANSAFGTSLRRFDMREGDRKDKAINGCGSNATELKEESVAP
jgi:hypothetical protein